jgi:hypothetical protein
VRQFKGGLVRSASDGVGLSLRVLTIVASNAYLRGGSPDSERDHISRASSALTRPLLNSTSKGAFLSGYDDD